MRRFLVQLSGGQLRTNSERLLLIAAEGLELATMQQLRAQYMLQAPALVDGSKRAALGHTADYQLKIDWLLSLGYQPDNWGVFLQSGRLSECRGLSASCPALVARLRFLQQRGFHLGKAASSGCKALLQWLHDEGCPRPVR
jgi:hypothetical protein